jgi:hypothetical protein
MNTNRSTLNPDSFLTDRLSDEPPSYTREEWEAFEWLARVQAAERMPEIEEEAYPFEPPTGFQLITHPSPECSCSGCVRFFAPVSR